LAGSEGYNKCGRSSPGPVSISSISFDIDTSDDYDSDNSVDSEGGFIHHQGTVKLV